MSIDVPKTALTVLLAGAFGSAAFPTLADIAGAGCSTGDMPKACGDAPVFFPDFAERGAATLTAMTAEPVVAVGSGSNLNLFPETGMLGISGMNAELTVNHGGSGTKSA